MPSITIRSVAASFIAQTRHNIAKLVRGTVKCGLDNLWIELRSLKAQNVLSQSLILKQKRSLGLSALVLGSVPSVPVFAAEEHGTWRLATL